MATGNNSNGYANGNRNVNGTPFQRQHDNFEHPDRVAKFHQCNPPVYTGETPNGGSGDWIHEVKAIMEASRYPPTSWVPLAAIQLRGEAATWWRSLNMVPWQLAWPEFSKMFLAQFPLSNHPR